MLETATRSQPLTSPPWPEQGQWAFRDWERLPDDGYRYELINGELVRSPPPAVAHQDASENLSWAMSSHVRKHKLGKIFLAPIGVRIPPRREPVQPDIIFISTKHLGIVGEKYIEGAPDLIVEIVSPSNWNVDRQDKFAAYARAGVKEYWIVDYRAKTIEVFLLEKSEYVLQGKFSKSQAVRASQMKGFAIKVDEVFAR